MSNTVELNSLADLRTQARDLISHLKAGDVILLTGELGTGKTTFTQNLAQELGVTADVTSPTFTIATEYKVTNHPQIKKMAHLDLYRLSDQQSQNEAVVRDALNTENRTDRLTVIEWADKLGAGAPKRAHLIHFAHGDHDNQRIMTIKYAKD